MLFREYGKTGKKISVIAFGGMRFQPPLDIEEGASLVRYAHDRGINYFDTAPHYCDDKSEEIMGLAFKEMKGGSFFVSTKSSKASGKKLRLDLDKSLRRLGVEKIDFFHLWCLLSLENWEERKSLGALEEALKAKEEGLIGSLCVSSHLQGGELSGVLNEGVFDGVTLGYSAINFPYREEAVKASRALNIGVVTMNPLGGGLIPSNSGRFSFLKTEKDSSVVEASLRFNLSTPGITAALVGFSNREQVDQAVSAVDPFLPHSEVDSENIKKNLLDSFDGICTGCQYCMPCPEGVEIPKMMDVYNRKILEGDSPQFMRDRLNWHWSKSPEHARLCSKCGICEEKCTQKLPIRERLDVIAAL